MKRRILPPLLALLTILAVGCSKSEEEAKGPIGPPPGTSLRLLVVDDPVLAEAIGYLKGEWQAQSGFALEIAEIAADEFDPGANPDSDVVIAPSWMLGPAARAGWTLPLPDQVLKNNESDWSGIFSQIRSHEVALSGKPMAVSFGSPIPVLYYRPDLLEAAGVKVPATWKDYLAATQALSDVPAAEPLAPGWAGLTLLARSAAYASHQDNLSTLFSISTMEPLIAGPPFVRALEELVESADSASLEMGPAAVRAAFWEGRAAMAITWPTAGDDGLDEIEPDFPAGVVELPGSADVFDVGDAAWEKRPKDSDGRVPLLAAAGRLGMVATTSQWSDAAWQVLLWLTDEKWRGQVCSASPNTTLFRNTQIATVYAWVERPMPADTARQYGDAIATALDRKQLLFAPRIPGREKYLAALDEAVRSAVTKEKSPQEALDAVAEQWKQITEELGVEKQKAAYRASLGLK